MCLILSIFCWSTRVCVCVCIKWLWMNGWVSRIIRLIYMNLDLHLYSLHSWTPGLPSWSLSWRWKSWVVSFSRNSGSSLIWACWPCWDASPTPSDQIKALDLDKELMNLVWKAWEEKQPHFSVISQLEHRLVCVFTYLFWNYSVFRI